MHPSEDDAIVDGRKRDAADASSSLLRFVELHWPRGDAAGDSLSEATAVRPPEDGQLPAIPPFRLLRELGRGGFGIVYLANDDRLNREVALKVLHPTVRHAQEFVQRFLREARATACLDHPNINQIYESGTWAGGLHIAFHYCPGPTLAEWISDHRGPVAGDHAARLILTLAHAVQHAHDRGVLHRDLKPSNVLLEPKCSSAQTSSAGHDLDDFVPKLTDFGLAKLMTELTDETRSGAMVGTLKYMSPEQAAGQSGAIGPASDVYALGTILYELLAGRPPFLGQSDADTLQQLQRDEPLAIRRLQSAVPRDLETVCLKCLEKDPARRNQTAGELADDLARYLDRRPIRSRRPTIWRHGWLWARRRPAWAVLTMSLLIITLGLPAGLLWHSVQLRRAFYAAEEQRLRAIASQALAETSAQAAQQKERQVRQHVYAADMRLAQQFLQDGDFSAMTNVLDRHPSQTSDDDRMRGFEWSLLSRFRATHERTLPAHVGEIDLVSFAADGRLLATSGVHDRTVRVFDVATGQQKAAFPVRQEEERRREEDAAAISPDGRRLASLVDANTIAVWDVETGEEQARLGGDQFICVAFSPDGSRLAAGSWRETKLWDCQTWQVADVLPYTARIVALDRDNNRIALVEAHPAATQVQVWNLRGRVLEGTLEQLVSIKRLCFSPDGTMIANLIDTPDASAVTVIKAIDRSPLNVILERGMRFQYIGFSADGRWLAAAAQDGSIRFWDSATGQAQAVVRGPAQRLMGFAFASDDSRLATATPDGLVHIWNRALLRPFQSIVPTLSIQGPIQFSPNGKWLAAVATDRTVAMVDVAAAQSRNRLGGHVDWPTDLAFSPDGERLLTTDGDRVRCWEWTGARVLWDVAEAGIKYLAWSSQGSVIATAAKDGTIHLRNPADGTEVAALSGHWGEIRGLRFLHGGALLCSASIDKTIRIWDVASRRPIGTPLVHEAPVNELTASYDGRRIAAGIYGGDLALWDVATDGSATRRKKPIPWFGGFPSSLTLSADCRLVANAGARGKLEAGDMEKGGTVYVLNGRRVGAASASYSPDGQTLATVSLGRSLTFWNPATWETRSVLGAPLQPVRSLGFSPDGRILAIGTDDSGEPDRPAHDELPARPNVRLYGPRRFLTTQIDHFLTQNGVPWDASASSVRLWDLGTGSEQVPLPAFTSLTPAPVLAWSKTGLLAAGSNDGTVWLWDANDRTQLARFAVHGASSVNPDNLAPRAGQPPVNRENVRRFDSVVAVQFSPLGTQLAAVTRRGRLRIADAGNWGSPRALVDAIDRVNCLAYDPQGRLLVHNDNGQIQFRDAGTGALSHTWSQPSEPAVTSVAFSPDGTLLALGRRDGSMQCLNVRDNLLQATLVGHIDSVVSLDFAPDGKTLASGSWDATVRLWNVATFQDVAALRSHSGKVTCVSFSPDGQTLASGGERDSDHGEVFLWRASR